MELGSTVKSAKLLAVDAEFDDKWRLLHNMGVLKEGGIEEGGFFGQAMVVPKEDGDFLRGNRHGGNLTLTPGSRG